MSEIPQLDIVTVRAAYERRVRATCPSQLSLALAVHDQLDPDHWMLEWHLPWWLGSHFGLDVETSSELVVSNVLGLASIRLHDDLVDGELDADDHLAAAALVDALYAAALERYRQRFPPTSPLWAMLGRRMAEWRAATYEDGPPDYPRRLAHRGAPLKISAYAVCLLTDRADLIPLADQCLDHALAGMVLYDHACDWATDLDAGRWNAFVAAAASHPQTMDHVAPNRSTLLVQMMSGDVIRTYFDQITSELRYATLLSHKLGVETLTSYLADLTARLADDGAMTHAHYGALGDRAATLIFGDYRRLAAATAAGSGGQPDQMS